MSTIRENLERVKTRMAAAAQRSARPIEQIKLLAVSKTIAAERILEAYEAGQRHFAENRVQELCAKTTVLPENINWHLIGHLQQNKVRAALQSNAIIHSVDSMKLLQRIKRIAEELQSKATVLLEVNISGEDSKFGLEPEQVEPLLQICQEDAVKCLGLMTIAPYQAEESELRRIFAALRELRDQLQQNCGLSLPELSMGMSGDFEAAIAEGATMLRIGSAIFGERTQ
ncbi:MAG: YggS family pyridoxal phosphate-dependent enzyme [Lentisphaeria bacterium]|nr:YggS family pyridoxal phosphate-dependent enzyme [Lentisphaeria bacterium]MDY0176156.1 YggS family pyridoxal phosphate-dependent enzyme [Lentisphaeria bacterium]